MKRVAIPAVLVLIGLIIVFANGSTARAALPDPDLTLVFHEEISVGEEVALAAYLLDPLGKPIRDATIVFSAEATVLNVTGEMKIGTAKTDSTGLALFAYTPRIEGEMPVRAQFSGNSVFAPAETINTLIVGAGGQLYYETRPFRIPGTSIWLVILVIALVWTIFTIVIANVLQMSRLGHDESGGNDAQRHGRRDDRLSKKRFNWSRIEITSQGSIWQRLGLGETALVPTFGIGLCIVSALVLILPILLRPWAGPDNSYETHLNYADPPEGYSRSNIAYVGEITNGPEGWVPSTVDTTPENEAFYQYVGYGCASCHGDNGSGTANGPLVAASSERRVKTLTREGPAGMPAYHETFLDEVILASISDFIVKLPEIPATPIPDAGPEPTPFPTATLVPSPTPPPTPTPVPFRPGEPTPTSIPTPSPTPTPEPTPTPDPARLGPARQLFIDVGCDLCHGVGGEGGDDGPALGTHTEDEIRKAVRDPERPDDSIYPKSMEPTTLKLISDQELTEILYYLSYLPLP